MRERLYWTVLGGLCFWLPSAVSFVLDRHLRNILLTLVILPLAGFVSLCAASWITSRREPKWGWILAGVYGLGSILNFALSFVIVRPPFLSLMFWSMNVRGEKNWRMILFVFLPPGIFWMAVLIVTPALVAMSLRPKRTVHQ